MVNKKFIKETFLKELDFYSKSLKVDYIQTPLFYKLHLDLDKDTFITYLKNFKKWIEENNEFGYLMLDKMFTFKEVEYFKIEFNQKEYKQIDYSSAIAWVNDFLQDNNFTLNQLLSFPEFTLEDTKNYSQLNVENTPLFFQHRGWGLDHMNKDKANPNTITSGWGRLKNTLEKLDKNIIFLSDGSEMRKVLNSTRNNQYYPNESHNSYLPK